MLKEIQEAMHLLSLKTSKISTMPTKMQIKEKLQEEELW